MSLKSTISRGLESAYDVVIDRIDSVFATAEVLLDEALPDPEEVSIDAKREALARFCEDKGYATQAEQYRTSNLPDGIVSFFYGLLSVSNPEYTNTTAPVDKEEAPKTPAQYLEYLKKNFPTMAKVYAQTLLEQERKNNAGHKAETEE